jgi:hypothetical protein
MDFLVKSYRHQNFLITSTALISGGIFHYPTRI